MGDVEAPASFLATAMLADYAVEPAFNAAGKIKIGAIDGQDERLVDDPGIEPVGHDQFDPERPAVGVGDFLPFVDPGEAMPSPRGRLTRSAEHTSELQSLMRISYAVSCLKK